MLIISTILSSIFCGNFYALAVDTYLPLLPYQGTYGLVNHSSIIKNLFIHVDTIREDIFISLRCDFEMRKARRFPYHVKAKSDHVVFNLNVSDERYDKLFNKFQRICPGVPFDVDDFKEYKWEEKFDKLVITLAGKKYDLRKLNY
mmetsp:Transcript_3716/g.4287  ORF Transcript_3716/g.4287 Transcript_3716/m.4287 type:complete len:145 (+) Transcript_3716:60-494(+)